MTSRFGVAAVAIMLAMPSGCGLSDTKHATPSCAAAVKTPDPAILVEAFAAARVRGKGASGCLTEGAMLKYMDPYCDDESLTRSPGPIVLYACGDHKVMKVATGKRPSSRGEAQLTVTLSGKRLSGNVPEIYEYITIRPGVPAGSTARETQVITSVTVE